MKNLKLRSHFLYTLLVAVLFVGCVDKNSQEVKQVEQSKNEGRTVYEFGFNKKVRVFEIDSCEYVAYDTGTSDGGTSIIHKQNCKFCLSRSAK
jgi:hypothetical protein